MKNIWFGTFYVDENNKYVRVGITTYTTNAELFIYIL